MKKIQRSPSGLTRLGRQVLSVSRALSTTSAALLVGALSTVSGVAEAAPVTVIPAASRVAGVPFNKPAEGLCTQFAAAATNGTVNNSTLAIGLIDNQTPPQANPQGVGNGVTNFFGISYLLDYFDDSAGTNGGFGFDFLFPWSQSDSGEICKSHQPATPVVRDAFAARYTGLINIRTPGTKTFAVGSDDGYQLQIGGVTVAEFQNNRSPAMDTRRATFNEIGVYPFQLVYWEQGGLALLEVSMSETEVVFQGNNRNNPVAVGAPNSNDLSGAAVGAFPASVTFGVLGD
jgi:hypothetical protein